ncbi:succinoglycan biosynthesis protein exop, partial [Halobacteriales archaeon SW_7_68_16]
MTSDGDPSVADADADAGADADPEAVDEALERVSHGAVVSFGAIGVQRALILATNGLLTAALGIVAYGVYAFAWQSINIVLRFAPLGTFPTIVKYVSAYDERGRREVVVGLAYLTTIVSSVVLAAGIGLGVDRINAATVDHPAFPAAFWALVLSIPAFALSRAAVFVIRGTERANEQVTINRIARPAVRLVAIVIAVAAGHSVVGVAGAIAVSTVAFAVVVVPYATHLTGLRPRLAGARAEARTFYDHALPNALTGVSALLRTRIDILLVGLFLPAAAAATGIYKIVLVLVNVAVIPLVAFNQLMPPVASRLHDDDATATLNVVYTTITRLIVTTTVPIVAVQLAYGPELLALFGSEFVRGYPVLAVFLAGRLVGNAVGATGWLLMMTEHQYARLALDWVLAVVNVGLSFVFVREFGLIGAALGTGSAIAVQNVLQIGLLRRFEGLYPFDRTFVKPVVAGVIALAAMAALRTVLSGIALIVAGTVAGLVVYWLAL